MRVKVCMWAARDRARCGGIAPVTGVQVCDMHRRALLAATINSLRSTSTLASTAEPGALALLDVLTPTTAGRR
jgi:hypothetical protein